MKFRKRIKLLVLVILIFTIYFLFIFENKTTEYVLQGFPKKFPSRQSAQNRKTSELCEQGDCQNNIRGKLISSKSRHKNQNKSRRNRKVKKNQEHCLSDKSYFDMKKRLEILSNVCKNQSVFDHVVYQGEPYPSFYHSNSYNFTFCHVAKAGGTFWAQMMIILETKADPNKVLFKTPRRKKLESYGALQKEVRIPLGRLKDEHQRIVVTSRDPYSRLFSAYIDKLFLAQQWKKSKLIKTVFPSSNKNDQKQSLFKENLCLNNFTFQDFLTSVLDQAYKGETLDQHWMPINEICNPCQTNAFMLVKQESFSRDVEYFMESIGVGKKKYNLLKGVLHDHRIEATIPSLIQTIFMNTRAVMNCFGKFGLAKRIWKSFQIQGYIDENFRFPKTEIFKLKKSNKSLQAGLTAVVLRIIKNNALSPEQSRNQRRRYLVQAYETVSMATIRRIQDVYFQDFMLFNYSLHRPS